MTIFGVVLIIVERLPYKAVCRTGLVEITADINMIKRRQKEECLVL